MLFDTDIQFIMFCFIATILYGAAIVAALHVLRRKKNDNNKLLSLFFCIISISILHLTSYSQSNQNPIIMKLNDKVLQFDKFEVNNGKIKKYLSIDTEGIRDFSYLFGFKDKLQGAEYILPLICSQIGFNIATHTVDDYPAFVAAVLAHPDPYATIAYEIGGPPHVVIEASAYQMTAFNPSAFRAFMYRRSIYAVPPWNPEAPISINYSNGELNSLMMSVIDENTVLILNPLADLSYQIGGLNFTISYTETGFIDFAHQGLYFDLMKDYVNRYLSIHPLDIPSMYGKVASLYQFVLSKDSVTCDYRFSTTAYYDTDRFSSPNSRVYYFKLNLVDLSQKKIIYKTELEDTSANCVNNQLLKKSCFAIKSPYDDGTGANASGYAGYRLINFDYDWSIQYQKMVSTTKRTKADMNMVMMATCDDVQWGRLSNQTQDALLDLDAPMFRICRILDLTICSEALTPYNAICYIRIGRRIEIAIVEHSDINNVEIKCRSSYYFPYEGVLRPNPLISDHPMLYRVDQNDPSHVPSNPFYPLKGHGDINSGYVNNILTHGSYPFDAEPSPTNIKSIAQYDGRADFLVFIPELIMTDLGRFEILQPEPLFKYIQ